MVRIGLSYHGGGAEYEAYPAALHRRAQALGLAIETCWLAGTDRPAQTSAPMHGVVLTGGSDVEPERYNCTDPALVALCKTDAQRDRVEWSLLEALQRSPLPTLAICRGAQLLNVFRGGTLVPDLGEKNAVHRRDGAGTRRTHAVVIAEGSRLHRIAGVRAGGANSSHHQAVERLAAGLCLSARSADGVIEAFEPAQPSEAFLLGVQWHPEAMEPGEPLADRVLDAFLRECSS